LRGEPISAGLKRTEEGPGGPIALNHHYKRIP
jgi:hypothetical protein